MNKRGFTLIELLAVIVVLAILVLLAMPRVTAMMERARVNSFVLETSQIAKVAQNAYNDSMFDNGDTALSTTCFTVDQLIDGGYLDKDKGEIRGAVVLDSNAATGDIKVYTYVSKDKYYVKGDIGSKTGKVSSDDVKKSSNGSIFDGCTTSCVATANAVSVKCGNTELTTMPSGSGSNVYTVTFDADGGVINGQEYINFDGTTHNVNGLIHNATWGDDHLIFDRSKNAIVNFGVYNLPTMMIAVDFSPGNIGADQFVMANVQGGGFYIGLKPSSDTSKPNYIFTNINMGGSGQVLYSKVAAVLNERYKLVVSYDGVYYKLYINGELAQKKTISTAVQQPAANTIPVILGGNPGGSTMTTGAVDGSLFSGKIYSAYLSSNPRYTKSIVYGDKYGTLPTPTKPYHTFIGWYDSSNNLVTSSTVYNTSGNSELVAKYTYNG